MATSDAQLRAQKKYDEAHKNDYTNFYLKCNNVDDADIIQHLRKQKNKNGYLKQLIRRDIEDKYIKDVMAQKKDLGIECPPIKSIEIEAGGI